ncbi:hypothetical protein A33I_18475 [Alkalihalophilus marmarensis DSM 21297]|uniref:Uncharacterized protein n=1 Tax=Alkalihalophilus marmarensis DSM 21297 TaxID=1188261 RepID=U6SK31_9BACI|nr:hypothetical protein A33I_18475 [Alkalihalophilus marmarensis DSM 21297]
MEGGEGMWKKALVTVLIALATQVIKELDKD